MRNLLRRGSGGTAEFHWLKTLGYAADHLHHLHRFAAQLSDLCRVHAQTVHCIYIDQYTIIIICLGLYRTRQARGK